jgi:ppGpp synthetase/RelA/SpoT-type nucleotidyltranferase
MTSEVEIRNEYIERFPDLVAIADRLQSFLKETLSGVERIDTITARAKHPDRYLDKAIKADDAGVRKYSNPKFEIQDQVGARITVLYLSDVERIRLHVIKYLRFIEQSSKFPESDSEFGYFGLHFIISMPDDVVSGDWEESSAPEFFELQIKTLFQHAWSECHHDLGYKSIRALTSEERRKMAFTAAQAWGADTIFEDMSRTLVPNDNDPPEAPRGPRNQS